MTKALTIEVPDDDEIIESRQPNTTPSSKTKEAGFFWYGKNSPTALEYKSLKSRALDLATRLSKKATQSQTGTPKNISISSLAKHHPSRKLNPNLIKVKLKQQVATGPKTEKLAGGTPKVFDFSRSKSTKSLKSLTPQNKNGQRTPGSHSIFKPKRIGPTTSTKQKRLKARQQTSQERAKSKPKPSTEGKLTVQQKPANGMNSYVTKVTAVEIGSQPQLELTEAQVKEKAELIYKEHLFQTFQALKFIKQLPPAPTA